MARAIIRAMPATENSRRLWMIMAFSAGMVFTAVLLQTLAEVNAVFPVSPGNHDLTPAVPADGYPVLGNSYRLVYACPTRAVT